MRRAAERPRSRPVAGSSGLATAARMGGLAGLAGALIVGLTWVGTRRFTRRDETVPIAARARPAQVVSTGAAADQNETRPAPPRLEIDTRPTPPRLEDDTTPAPPRLQQQPTPA